MLRNISNRLLQEDLMRDINSAGLVGQYDFFLPAHGLQNQAEPRLCIRQFHFCGRSTLFLSAV